MTDTTQARTANPAAESFAALFEASTTQSDQIQEGDIVSGSVLKVGKDTVVVDITKHEIKDGDQFVLCSDGLSGMLDDKTIGRIVREATTLENAVAELIEQANRAGGTDNITAMLIQCNL